MVKHKLLPNCMTRFHSATAAVPRVASRGGGWRRFLPWSQWPGCLWCFPAPSQSQTHSRLLSGSSVETWDNSSTRLALSCQTVQTSATSGNIQLMSHYHVTFALPVFFNSLSPALLDPYYLPQLVGTTPRKVLVPLSLNICILYQYNLHYFQLYFPLWNE